MSSVSCTGVRYVRFIQCVARARACVTKTGTKRKIQTTNTYSYSPSQCTGAYVFVCTLLFTLLPRLVFFLCMLSMKSSSGIKARLGDFDWMLESSTSSAFAHSFISFKNEWFCFRLTSRCFKEVIILFPISFQHEICDAKILFCSVNEPKRIKLTN